MDLEEDLRSITDVKGYSNGFLCRCPFAKVTHPRGFDRSPSLVVFPEYGFWRCYSCGMCGSVQELFTKLADTIPSDKHLRLADKWRDSMWEVRWKLREKPSNTELVELDEQILSAFPTLEDYSYLHGRGISNESIKFFDIRWDSRSKMVVFPVRNFRKRLVGFVGRSVVEKSHRKYFFESSLVLGGEDKLKYERIVVVEGFMDVLKCWPWANELGLDVVCCWTATLSRHQIKTLAKLDKFVYLMLDQDAAGNNGAAKFGKEYPGLCTRLQWDFLNSKGEVADVGDMNETQFKGFF